MHVGAPVSLIEILLSGVMPASYPKETAENPRKDIKDDKDLKDTDGTGIVRPCGP
jgi:hypothetical protein